MTNAITSFPLTLYYDASCRFCNAEMTNLMLRNTQGRLCFINCAEPGFQGGPAPQEHLMRSIHGVDAQGRVFVGVDCLARAYEGIGWTWAPGVFKWPVIHSLANRLYPVIARNRYRMPKWPVVWILESAARRAAERTARHSARCQGGRCDLDDHIPHH
ncbi:thiol-disulfide oxidoreductase DCC family protein [Ottowia thiooxydans]|uniref:DCC family thiol-disulfide oxidoreductase YuxK n=1 Tax=Ottowia thiooxydans TaxID=219182 RepID=A0ABV2QF60_9BURK